MMAIVVDYVQAQLVVRWMEMGRPAGEGRG